MSEHNLLILYSYDGFFATKFVGTVENHVGTTMDVNRLKDLFEKKGCHVELVEVSQVDWTRDYSGWNVIYPSSEDIGLFYKEYIEDVLCALSRGGARLLPSFDYFRAHSNKSYQEMIRQQFNNLDLRHPSAYSIGHISELEYFKDKVSYPVVVKISDGAGSNGVALAHDEKQMEYLAMKLMNHRYMDFSFSMYRRMRRFAKRLLRCLIGIRKPWESVIRPYQPTNKIVLEEYIPGLDGDYKVLVFDDKYFVLSRKNRDNDFRASGSGKFTYPDDIRAIENVLELAEAAAKEIDMPVMSLDIGQNHEGCYLIEFQCVHFGPYTLQYAPWCFSKKSSEWTMTSGTFDLEEEYVGAIMRYLEKNRG